MSCKCGKWSYAAFSVAMIMTCTCPTQALTVYRSERQPRNIRALHVILRHLPPPALILPLFLTVEHLIAHMMSKHRGSEHFLYRGTSSACEEMRVFLEGVWGRVWRHCQARDVPDGGRGSL